MQAEPKLHRIKGGTASIQLPPIRENTIKPMNSATIMMRVPEDTGRSLRLRPAAKNPAKPPRTEYGIAAKA